MSQEITYIDTRHRANRTDPVEAIAPRWIRPSTFAAATGMSRRGVNLELNSGRLRGVKINQSWFIRVEELDAYFERNGKRVAA